MQRFENILFVNAPASASSTALQRAVRLAQANQARLTVVGVVQEIPRSMSKLQDTFLRLQKEQLAVLLEKSTVDGFEVDSKVLVGTAFLEIIKEVVKGKYDLLIKPASGRGGMSSMLFGSTDLHLFRKCPCPVWIIKPSRRKTFSRILAAVDPDPEEPENAELNRLILDLATSLARREGSDLHIVHAWSAFYESMLRSGRSPLPKLEVDRHVRMARKEHKEWLSELLANYDFTDLAARVHLVKGEPGDVIPSMAYKKSVELIVMGTVARTGIPGFLIGNTAEKTLNKVDCSVLAVKPASFTTPVKR